MFADTDSVCGAAYGTRDPERTNRRNGYRHRDLDTKVDTMDVALPSCGMAHTSGTGCSSDDVTPPAGARNPAAPSSARLEPATYG